MNRCTMIKITINEMKYFLCVPMKLKNRFLFLVNKNGIVRGINEMLGF